MCDWAGRPAEHTQAAFLSRALAALAIKALAHANVDIASASITDGFDDGGIDALYFDPVTDTFFIVRLDDFVEELNDPVDVAEAQYFSQTGVYSLITAESEPTRIDLQVGLRDWGAIDRPFLAYYGRVHVSEIAQWWRDHRNALFSHNLRLFYRSSDVNDALRATLEGDFENFWYFNNGITIICDNIVKAAVVLLVDRSEYSPVKRLVLSTAHRLSGQSALYGARHVSLKSPLTRMRRKYGFTSR